MLISPGELSKKMLNFSYSYFLVDARNDRESYFALSVEQLKENPLCVAGVFLNYIMEGKLKEAWDIIDLIPEESTPGRNFFLKKGLVLVHPEVTWKEFIETLDLFRRLGISISSVVLTAARPTLLNGFNDFTRLGPFLEKRKDLIIEYVSHLYGKECAPFIYKLCLAEYYYQINNLLESEVLVSHVIKEFDAKSERRLLFAALSLQSRILLTQGRTVNAESYIQDIRKLVKEAGKAEFSYNIDAAEVKCAFYEGNYSLVNEWFKNNAPDEFSDFNMLDLYRYMIKIRCYIITEKYAAVVALTEKLRPLLILGKRHMDLCEIDILLAVSFYNAGKKDLAFEALGRALKLVKRRKYYRLIADEGEAVIHLLIEYVNLKGSSHFLMDLIKITREMAIKHPLYLKVQYENNKVFSPMEIDVLKLLEQGKTKEDIGEYFFISVNTVKYHIKKIYGKLGVSSAHQAVWKARISGII
ncbi:LuxR C-terminal-related transcriptional regulator [Treponema sp.]|uniref:LuxR C-terminal-related transcriptional regulator n=1 Tax=Treponema sp. TaxID=166 RepID=UPI0025CFB7A4|nr:LuxR C-terminal-related transcriptional regulator [Treponema sp.]MCR5218161.1 LuxR C-terminal-related transcriptional regulator [Treponema sp.]